MFSGKTVIITGASSGLGEALAVELAALRARTILFGRNEAKLRETEKRCRDARTDALVVTGDVTKPEDCERLIRLSVERYGTLDYLVASAGVSMWARFDEVEDPSIFRKIMDTNYLGAVYCTYYALPHLKKNRGMIVAVSSIQGKIPVPLHTGYAASKHALHGFFDTLRTELVGSGVDILLVLPHWLTGTRLRESAYGKNGRLVGEARGAHSRESISVERCRDEIIKAMKKRRKELILPSKLKFLPWLSLIRPGIVEYIVKSKMKAQERRTPEANP